MRRIGALAGTVALLIAVAAPASATPAGNVVAGSADFAKIGQPAVLVSPLASCDVNPDVAGVVTGTAPAVSKAGVKFGTSAARCTTTVVNEQDWITTTKSEAEGTDFELSALVAQGGPRLRVAKWKITCDATQTGTSAGWTLAGMSGWTGLPQQLPQGYVHDVKGKNGVVLAKVKFTEVVFPVPNDGSITMHLAKLTFEPASGYRGEIKFGSAACSPTP
ncbi:hypothetical protein ACIA8G_20150 [Lentzea sp. NPDC051213]|uniref:hypothetical protein n=1 Tax=Lentzea sp. NPDC051213 TaxID=3364126 RepID=UPI00379C6FDC